jgi:RHS repeat-associated protein
VVALTDASGSLVESYEYEAFGRAIVKDSQGNIYDRSTVGNPYMFAGMIFDPETEFDHATFREQDPDTGGFLQEDPLDPSGGGVDSVLFSDSDERPQVNLYEYARNQPFLYTDPEGLQAIPSPTPKTPPPPPGVPPAGGRKHKGCGRPNLPEICELTDSPLRPYPGDCNYSCPSGRTKKAPGLWIPWGHGSSGGGGSKGVNICLPFFLNW